MDSGFILSKLSSEFGSSGLIAATLIYIVFRIERHLIWRAELDNTEKKEYIEIIKNNTEAMTTLSTIIRSRNYMDDRLR